MEIGPTVTNLEEALKEMFFIGSLSDFKKSEYYQKETVSRYLPRIFAGKLERLSDDIYFSVQMTENTEFHRWYKEEYLEKYPIPPREKIIFTSENIHPYGFRLLKEDWDKNIVSFSLEGIVDYLVTQSNVTAAVEDGKEEIEEVRVWLTESIKSMFGNSKENFLFNAPVWYLNAQPNKSLDVRAKQ